MSYPGSSLIISTYNRPDALKVSVESAFRQSKLPSAIIIADDGSTSETGALVKELANQSPVPLQHVWQPDEGYQLAKIRNRAFAAANTDYIIQVDGDLVLDENFVSDHLKAARIGTFISGSRTMVNEKLTLDVMDGSVPPAEIKSKKENLSQSLNAVRSGILSRLTYWYQRHNNNYKYVIGCNMAFWKKDLIRVNGYDENFRGWGKEDNDLAVRLQNAGVKLRFLKFGGITYHLHHPVSDLSSVPANEEKLQETIREKRTFAKEGLDRYLEHKV